MSTPFAIVSTLSAAAAGIATVFLGGRRAPAALLCCPRHGSVMAVRDGQCEPYEGDVHGRPFGVCPLPCLAGAAPPARVGGHTDPFSF